MKKKIAMLTASVCAMALLVTGCSKGISNDYISVKQYKGVEVEKQDAEAEEITDEAVESQIQAILEQKATTEEITDRAVASGDTATIDYEGKLDGVAFEGGTSTDYPLEIGSGAFIEGFEDAIIGHNIGETFDIDVTFPEEYQNTDLAGKPVVFTVTVKSISKQNVPELNDEFVKTVSTTAATVEDYKKEVKETLKENQNTTAEADLKTAAWEALLANVEVKKYPQERLQNAIKALQEQFQTMAEQYQMEFADFLESYVGMDEDTFNTQVSKTAKDQIKQELVVELIGEKEKLALTEDELKEKYEEYAENYGYESVDAMKEDATEDTLKNMANKEAVQEWVTENCKQVEKKADTSSSTGTETKE